MSDLIVPDFLLTQIREGKVIPLLGAGASLAVPAVNGKRPPTTKELGQHLSKRFLGEKYHDYSLTQIGEYAISESSLRNVQEFIATLFVGLEPSPSHKLLTTFRWWGIATTNYDRFIERAYETAANPAQSVHAIIDDRDRIEDYLRDPKSLVLLKLHGCITRTDDSSCPLVLTTDQYIDHRAGRDQLFKTLEEWATENPLLYIGHSLQDPDLRAILNRLSIPLINRPRHYLVTKNIQPEEIRFWEAKRVTPVIATFEDFMAAIDRAISSPFRQVIIQTPTARPELTRHFRDSHSSISGGTQSFLDLDVLNVRLHNANANSNRSRILQGG